jgi:hypothetical protein
VEWTLKKKKVPFKVTATTMNEHSDEEHGIEVRDWCCSTNDCSPGEAHGPVGNVILPINVLASIEGAWKIVCTGLREYAHQPLVRRRLLKTRGIKY